MHFHKTAKAILLIVNHVAAIHIPPHVTDPSRLQNAKWESSTGLKARTTSILQSDLHLAPRANPKRDSCSRCRRKCWGNRFINPADCRKCIPCPPGLHPDPLWKICLPDSDEEKKKAEEAKNNPEKEKKYEAKKELKKKEYPRKKKEQKYGSKKELRKKSYVRKQESKQDNEKRKRVRRIGRCLSLVAIAMGAMVVAEYGDEFFDENFLESMDLLEFWPKDLDIEPWDSEESDKLFEEDWYVEKWVAFGNSIDTGKPYKGYNDWPYEMAWKRERSLRTMVFEPEPIRTLPSTSKANLKIPAPSNSIALAKRDEEINRRFFFLIPIFSAAVRAGVAAGRAAAKAGRVTKNSIKVSPGRGKKSPKEQRDGAEKISKSKNWQNCLKLRTPS